jgi:hypothetical protein
MRAIQREHRRDNLDCFSMAEPNTTHTERREARTRITDKELSVVHERYPFSKYSQT